MNLRMHAHIYIKLQLLVINNFCTIKLGFICKYGGCPKMPYNCIKSFKFKTSISLIHMYHVGNLFLDIMLKLHKIS